MSSALEEGQHDKKPVETTVPAHTSSWSAERKRKYASYIESQEALQNIEAHLVCAGDKVIVETPKGNSFFTVQKGKTFRVQKDNIKSESIIGKPYGVIFDVVKGGKLTLAEKKHEGRSQYDESFEPTKNNSKVFKEMGGEKIKISAAEVDELRKEKTGEEVLKAVVEANEGFDQKSEFAQEKYMKKKKKKHCPQLKVTRPTIPETCRLYLVRNPKKTMSMRKDTLGYILSSANIQAGSRTMVVDTVGGLVVAAIVQRQGGFGKIFQVSEGGHPKVEACRKIGFSIDHYAPIVNVPLSSTKTLVDISKERATDILDSLSTSTSSPAISRKETENSAEGKEEEGEGGGKDVEKVKLTSHEKAVIAWKEVGAKVDSLVLACKYLPIHIVKKMFPLLAPSGLLVVYSQQVEPLNELVAYLRSKEAVCNTEIAELWFREYQVLPNRTHPMMNTESTGGYVLTATKIVDS